MRANLRNAVHAGARPRAPRTLPLAILLAVVVIAAAGLAGPSRFTGVRASPLDLTFGGHRVKTTTNFFIFKNVNPRHVRQKPLPPNEYWIVVVAGGVLLVVLAVLWLTRRVRGRRLEEAPSYEISGSEMVPTPVPESEPEPEVFRSGIELAIEALEDEREPADAVVRAWLGFQETAEQSGIARRPSETPTEFAARVLSRVFTDDRALRTLLQLYLRTRFSEREVTPEDVSAVRDALQQLLDNWHWAGGVAGARVR